MDSDIEENIDNNSDLKNTTSDIDEPNDEFQQKIKEKNISEVVGQFSENLEFVNDDIDLNFFVESNTDVIKEQKEENIELNKSEENDVKKIEEDIIAATYQNEKENIELHESNESNDEKIEKVEEDVIVENNAEVKDIELSEIGEIKEEEIVEDEDFDVILIVKDDIKTINENEEDNNKEAIEREEKSINCENKETDIIELDNEEDKTMLEDHKVDQESETITYENNIEDRNEYEENLKMYENIQLNDDENVNIIEENGEGADNMSFDVEKIDMTSAIENFVTNISDDGFLIESRIESIEKIEKNQIKRNEDNKANFINEEENDNRYVTDNDDLNNIKEAKYKGVSNFFTVHIQLDDGSIKNQLVTIINSKSKKAFLGGFRHKLSKKEYHHAAVQTQPKPRPPPKVQLFSRDTQTFQMKHQKINTDSTTSTQMTKPGFYTSNVTDKLLAPNHYETADEYEARILNNIIIIQKYYRRWLAKHIVDEKRKQRDDRLSWEDKDKERKRNEKEERIRNEYKRRMHPKTKADFDLLYNDLEKWREERLFDIENSDLTTAEKKARKALLLEEETDLLAAIDRHKIDRKGETKIEAVQKILSKAAAPKTWKDTKGRKIEMDTQFTIRSRELLDIFNSLNMQYLTSDERLDVLLTLKHTVKEHDCKLTKEIVELVDREADLIMRNIKEASLVGLRKRISTLFLQYCKTPTFNPQISLLLKVPPDPSVLIGDINYCKYCGRYLKSTDFSLSTKSSKLTICKSCARKDNQSRNRQDYSHYRRILKEIQMNEQQIGDNSKIAFIFKQNDVKSLIESVWDGKSIMSGCDDLDEMEFIRWDQKEHWSPWNTIFVTKEEAEAHLKVSNIPDTYSHVLINRIVQKHVIARNLFGSLEKMVNDLQSKSLK